MRRGHGDGGIDARGPGSWRLRYRVSGKRHAKTFHGTKTEAQRELRRQLSAADQGQHVAPDRITLNQWAERWLAIGARADTKRKWGRERLIAMRN
jgi:integrase